MNTINEPNKRIDALDYLRGLALMGIVLMNILPLLHLSVPETGSADAAYQKFLFLFIEGRFYTLFSFLFGVGFYIFITNATAKGQRGYVLFLRRIAALLLFGIVHSYFHPGEALTVYAVCGLLVMPLYKARKEINLAMGIILLIVFGVISLKILMPIALILLGLSAGQYGVFQKLSQNGKNAAYFTAAMFLFSAIGLAYQYMQAPNAPFYPMISAIEGEGDAHLDQANKFMETGLLIGPVVSAFYAGLLMLALRVPVATKILSPLKYYGRMALTNYIGQTVLITLAGRLFDLNGHITYLQSLYVCMAIYVVQLLFSAVWLQYFLYGPLEWIWRLITYFKAVPLLRKRMARDHAN